MNQSRKHQTERNQQILKSLLKEQPNKFCVDCKTSKNPRWASWNLGCFICIRCSGIHRSMGTHISRVKSVDLDTWTDEQVKSMVLWGNAKANLYWEDKLPNGYIPDESKIENFIRTKYDLKKWCSSSNVPDPRTLSGTVPTSSSTVDELKRDKPQPGIPTTSQHSPRPLSQPKPSPSLLDFGDAPVQPQLPTPSALSKEHQAATSSSSSSSLSFIESPASVSSLPKSNNNARPDLKKSILSLYSTPSQSANSSFNSLPTMSTHNNHTIYQQQQSLTTTAVNNTSSLSNSLSNLNFGPASTKTAAAQSMNPSNSWSSASSSPALPTTSYNINGNNSNNNVWSSMPINGSSGSKKTNENDAFKNVWS